MMSFRTYQRPANPSWWVRLRQPLNAGGGSCGYRQGLGVSFECRPGEFEMFVQHIMQNAKDWTQILYQLGLGVAAWNTLK